MNQRTALTLAAALTAFVLVVLGSLVFRLTQSSSATTVSSTATVSTATTASNPDVQAIMQQRETAYQQALEQANQQLQDAYAREHNLNQQPQTQLGAATTNGFAISGEQASSNALNLLTGAALLKAPELVSFQGTPAYEVTLDKGTVYIDANNGQVLYSDTSASGPITQEQAAQIASTYSGNSNITEVELERERHMEVYAVHFADGSEVYVDRASGQVAYARMQGGAGEEHEEHDNDD